MMTVAQARSKRVMRQGQSCFRKKSYRTLDEAKRAIVVMVQRQVAAPNSLHYYPCEECAGYHVGHVKKEKK